MAKATRSYRVRFKKNGKWHAVTEIGTGNLGAPVWATTACGFLADAPNRGDEIVADSNWIFLVDCKTCKRAIA